jgi:3-methylfumaryl-CoA hydratase
VSNGDLAHLRQWIGKTKSDTDIASARHARLMAATLGLAQEKLDAGSRLPPLWHWLYHLEGRPPGELGRDGHPARGDFLPPVPLANRMWAGGRISFLRPLRLGAALEKRSIVTAIEHKVGRSGDLVFVTVLHELFHSDEPVLTEEHDIVYRNPSERRPSRDNGAPPEAEFKKAFNPDSTMLFRYSALTFNGHRIHYDIDYCRDIEGYDNLVVHGPLCATLLAGFAEEVTGRLLRGFTYRGLCPAILGPPLILNASVRQDDVDVWTTLPDGGISMRATAKVN